MNNLYICLVRTEVSCLVGTLLQISNFSLKHRKQIELGEQLRSIRKAIQYQGYIIICSDMDGILIYKIMLDDGHRLKFIQKLEIKDPGNPPIDM